MNRLNWIQQEQKIADYHVLTWKTSHFHHPIDRPDVLGAAGSKFDMGGGAVSLGEQQQADGMGLGLTDPAENMRWKEGGLGADGMAEEGAKAVGNQEVAATSDRTRGRQVTALVETWSTEQIVPEELYGILRSVRQSILKVHDCMKQSSDKLRDVYQKQRKQAAGTPKRSLQIKSQAEICEL